MRPKRYPVFSWVSAVIMLSAVFIGTASGEDLSPMEQLGKFLFFDTDLSINNNQSCATCHAAEAGWTGPDSDINAAGSVYEGSEPGRFGNRKPPSAAYATPSPILHFRKQAGGMWVGGNFWDGRATGERLGNPAAEQAQGPFLNPMEQALPTVPDVVERVCSSAYANLFLQVWGDEVCEPANVLMAYDDIALSIAAYEASSEVNAFSSKFDYSLKGKAKLSKQERKGFSLFMGKGKCSRCHTGSGHLALFTDFTYDNLGIPKNPLNPFYDADPEFNPEGDAWVDPGLGAFLESLSLPEEVYDPEFGKFKVPTLRNVDKRPDSSFVKAYGHNGYFKSLKGIVHFYNTRDVKSVCPDSYTEAEALAENCWPPPEEPRNVNTEELGNLGLDDDEEDAIVAFLKTLSDGFNP